MFFFQKKHILFSCFNRGGISVLLHDISFIDVFVVGMDLNECKTRRPGPLTNHLTLSHCTNFCDPKNDTNRFGRAKPKHGPCFSVTGEEMVPGFEQDELGPLSNFLYQNGFKTPLEFDSA